MFINEYELSKITAFRMLNCTINQLSKMNKLNIINFENNLYDIDLNNKNYLITGCTYLSLGYEISKELLLRNCTIYMTFRTKEKAEKTINELKKEYLNIHNKECDDNKLNYLLFDLSNFNEIKKSINDFINNNNNIKFDCIIDNAAIAPTSYNTNNLNYEMSIAVNILGHHYLKTLLINNNLLIKNKTRIVYITGDIYALAKDCDINIKKENFSSSLQYSNSKLGIMWMGKELQKKYKDDYIVSIVHPGVFNSNLIGTNRLVKFVKKSLLITSNQAAQICVIAAIHPKLNEKDCSYYTNITGLTKLPNNDLANDVEKSSKFFQQVDNIVQDHL